jgi:hypothetical protein
MKHALSWTLAFIASAMIALAPNPAYADAVGPYYAPPSWDQTLPASTRFIVLSNFNSQAVLDRETGLVWEKSPSTATYSWGTASVICVELALGGRAGWRLPTIQELLSLLDRSVPFPGPTLPSGHPFTVQSSGYWSATTFANDAGSAWFVNVGNGFVGVSDKLQGILFRAWCVRGGHGVDAQ